MSPVVWILAVGGLLNLKAKDKPAIYLALFVVFTYAIMAQVKYGMNLRYANMWDMPLRFLALSTLVAMVAPLQRYRNVVLGVSVALICAVELRQYYILAVQYPLYELITHDLLRALHILK